MPDRVPPPRAEVEELLVLAEHLAKSSNDPDGVELPCMGEVGQTLERLLHADRRGGHPRGESHRGGMAQDAKARVAGTGVGGLPRAGGGTGFLQTLIQPVSRYRKLEELALTVRRVLASGAK